MAILFGPQLTEGDLRLTLGALPPRRHKISLRCLATGGCRHITVFVTAEGRVAGVSRFQPPRRGLPLHVTLRRSHNIAAGYAIVIANAASAIYRQPLRH